MNILFWNTALSENEEDYAETSADDGDPQEAREVTLSFELMRSRRENGQLKRKIEKLEEENTVLNSSNVATKRRIKNQEGE